MVESENLWLKATVKRSFVGVGVRGKSIVLDGNKVDILMPRKTRRSDVAVVIVDKLVSLN